MENKITSTTRTTETVTISSAEYEELLYAKSMFDWMKEQLETLKKDRFGSKAEASGEEVSKQVSLFDEPELNAYLEEVELKRTTVAEHERIRKERHFVLDDLPKGAEVQVTEHRLSSDEQICPNCGSQMQEIGKEVVRSIEIVPAKIVVHEDHYYTYACKKSWTS